MYKPCNLLVYEEVYPVLICKVADPKCVDGKAIFKKFEIGAVKQKKAPLLKIHYPIDDLPLRFFRQAIKVLLNGGSASFILPKFSLHIRFLFI